MRIIATFALTSLLLASTDAFTVGSNRVPTSAASTRPFQTTLYHAPMAANAVEATGFIATELRGAAMKLHTKMQSPKEGKVEDKPQPAVPYTPTHLDYLKFLVDSQHVYKAMEEIVQMQDLQPELSPFINTGLERVARLEQDIDFISSEYDVARPDVGSFGTTYAEELRNIASGGKEAIPEFMCHYYNYYFAHTAGGRMIGKRMASILLEKKTLEFYKWDGDINSIKETVKGSIEDMAAGWSREQKDRCVEGTMGAFKGGGGINAYLSGGRGGGHH